MNRTLLIVAIGSACLTVTHAGLGQITESNKMVSDWKSVLAERMPEYGHRNWIVIADSAYPAQTRAGIETIVTHENQLTVVKTVLEQLGKAKHVRPVVYLDKELGYVSESDAAGIEAYRNDLTKLLANRNPASLPHEQ